MGNSDKMRRYAPFCLTALLVGFGAMSASADTLYNTIPVLTTPAGGITVKDTSESMPFDENGVSQFGGLISLTSSANVTSATVALSNWAQASNYAGVIDAGSYTDVNGNVLSANGTDYQAKVTLNLYSVGPTTGTYNGDPLYSVGASLGTYSTTATIDWRPAPTNGDPNQFGCTDGSRSFQNGSVDQCGEINLVNFSLSANLPSTFIYTISVGSDGVGGIPVDSLNLGLNSCAAQDQSNPFCSVGNANGVGFTNPDTAYYNGPAGLYSAGVPFTADTVQGDTGWGSGGGYGAVSFSGTTLTPEPASFGLIGFGLLGLGIVARKKSRKS